MGPGELGIVPTMIRSPGRGGSLKAAAVVLWQLRGDLLVVVGVAAAMALLADAMPLRGAAQVVPLLGVVVSIFIGFRNTSAYNRWWEARTLWGAIVANCNAFDSALTAVDDDEPAAAAAVDRMRRRQVRHAWQLNAELRGLEPAPGVVALTPEDGPDVSAHALLKRQAAEVRDLVAAGAVDRQGRVVLTTLNTAQAGAAGGLDRIRTQPLPLYYSMFVRALAWFFAILVCTRLETRGLGVTGLLPSVAIMSLFVIAERMGHFAEQPMSNTVFDLPMNRFCAAVTADLLGPGHPLAKPREGERATVWM